MKVSLSFCVLRKLCSACVWSDLRSQPLAETHAVAQPSFQRTREREERGAWEGEEGGACQV